MTPLSVIARGRGRTARVLLALSVFALSSLLLVAVRPARGSEPELLPNLVADPPDNVHIETSAFEGGISKTAGKPKLLLRFNGYVHNDGAGPLDIHGEREGVSKAYEAEVETIQLHNQEEEARGGTELFEFSPSTEKALATPAMTVTQQLFATNAGAPTTDPKVNLTKFGEENEKYLQRPAKKVATSAQMEYVSADGHHHWHLERVAKYSLWNAAKTAEVAPSQKVGFCLEDSEHREATDAAGATGPQYPVYSDASPPYRDFCQQWRPNATFVFEGISPGWRDRYDYTLGLQWVDISEVKPGKYWLREEVNPEHKIREEHEATPEKITFATEPTIVPGFVALPNTVETPVQTPVRIIATSEAWDDTESPLYEITRWPQHGTLEPLSGTNEAIYTPEPGYRGSDSYRFTASDPTSEFPLNPVEAEVAIDVGGASAPQVTISGEPSEMIAGTSVQLTAQVLNDSPTVTWSASAGSITQGGLFTAPAELPPGATVTVSARSSKGVEKRIEIAIKPVPAAQNLPGVPSPTSTAPPSGSSTPAPAKASRPPVLARPQAILINRELVMSTRVTKAGRVRLSAHLGRRLLGSCSAKTPANRGFTCRIELPRGVSTSARIGVLATLQIGHELLRSQRPAARVPEMKMAGAHARASVRLGRLSFAVPAAWQLWCSPSMAM